MEASRTAMVAVALLAVVRYSLQANAYEVETHRLLSEVAVDRSLALGSVSHGIYSDLGMVGNEKFFSSDHRQESIRSLVGLGAVEEDNVLWLLRPIHHFFDPQHTGRGLEVGSVQAWPSPDWILEDRFSIGLQEYSLRDARERFFLAMTLADPAQRSQRFSEMIERLGHVLHHIQDMAQPQHVRNDQHLMGVDTSLYERWAMNRPQLIRSLASSSYAAIDAASFRKARDFWVNQGKGIAEFTSTNFVSEGTNFWGEYPQIHTDAEYPLPAAVPCSVQEIPATQLMPEDMAGSSVLGKVTFIGTQVNDAYRPELSGCNPRTTSYSLFFTDLRAANIGRGYWLNSYNFMSQLQRLAPRAVVYSAGLIDHFFRGRLAVESFAADGAQATLVVKNVSRGDATLRDSGNSARPWEFAMYYDTQDGSRKQLPVVDGDIVGKPITAGQTYALIFDYPQDLATDREKPFMLVFDGVIGEEPGVAGLALAALPLKGFLVQPSYPPGDGTMGARLIAFQDGRWELASQSGLKAGNVDWRGNEPGEVLTWDGPPSRYFYSSLTAGGYSPRIYHQGRVLANAPGNIHGVAIRGNGSDRWLTVAIYTAGQLQLYQRPFREHYDDDELYHAILNPYGWRLLHAVSMQPPATPFFFNASGTQAQGIVGGNFSGDRFRTRVRLDIGTSVALSTVSAKGSGTWSVRSSGTYQPISTMIEGTGNVCWETPDEIPQYACRTPGTCSPPTGGTFDVCRLKALEYRIDADGSNQSSVAYTFDHPTTVCADYRGDQEVLCVIDREALSRASIEYHRTYYSASSVTTDAACGTGEVYRSTNSAEGTTRTRNSSAHVLRFGAIEIPLDGHIGEYVLQEDGRLTLETASPGYLKHASASVSNVTTEYNTRILYLDARNDLAAVELNNRTRTVTGQSNDLLQINGPAWSYPMPEALKQERTREMAVFIGTQKHSLSRQVLDTSSSPTSSTYRSFLGTGGPPNCKGSETSDSQPPQPFQEDFSIDARLLLFPASQGYAVDAQGRIAISQTIWQVQPNGSYTAAGVWNFLSDGELTQTIPPGAQGATFYPIGVID